MQFLIVPHCPHMVKYTCIIGFFIYDWSLRHGAVSNEEGVLNLSDIRRLYVRKKAGFRQGEESLISQLKEVLGDRLEGCGIYHRYDVDGLSGEDYEKAVSTVFSEIGRAHV